MSQSENINELACALSKAQGEMQAAIKDSVNPFFKSKYADLGSVWDAARPVLSKNGLCVMQTTEIQGERVIMITTLVHSSGQWVKSYLPLNPAKNDSQGMGAAITYLRRYSLSALVGVVCDDDDDGETAVGRGKTKQNQPPLKQENRHNPETSQKFTLNTQNKPGVPTLNQENKHDSANVDQEKISFDQLTEIMKGLAQTDDQFRENYTNYMKKNWNITEYENLLPKHYHPTMTAITRNIELNSTGAI